MKAKWVNEETKLATATVVLLLSCAFSSCTSSEDLAAPSNASTAPVVLSSLELEGDTSLVEGNVYQYTAKCHYSDESRRNCPVGVVWAAYGQLALMNDGRVRAIQPGLGEVVASYEKKADTVRVTVKKDGVPWESVGIPISDAGKEYLKRSNFSNGGSRRFEGPAVRVWFSDRFLPKDQQESLVYWNSILGNRLALIPGDSASARIHVVVDSTVGVEICGYAEHILQGSLIVGGLVGISDRANCSNNPEGTRVVLAHDIGHVLGLWAHTPGCDDVLGSPCSAWAKSSLLIEAVTWIYSVPPGTKPY